MIAVELAECYVVTASCQSNRDFATATVDGQNVVSCPVRYENARLASRKTVDDEAGRECEHTTEEISIYQSKRQRIRGSIGKTAEYDSRNIDGSRIQCALDGSI
jgi:hypothetical protein